MSSGSNNTIILSLLSLVFFIAVGFLYLFGLGGVGLFDVTEAQTAQISAQAVSPVAALTSPTLMAAPFLQTPPLIHYLQSLSYTVFGVTPFAARLPSVLAGFLLVFVFYNATWVLTQRRRFALLAAATLALSPALLLAARLATPMAVFMLLTLSATLMLIGNIYHAERSYMRLFVAGLILGLAFLAGGIWAYILALFVAFVLALLKDHRGYNFASLAPFSVLVASLIAVLPWAFAVLKAHGVEGLKAYVMAFSGPEALTGSLPAAPWWHLLFIVALLTLPWALFALPALWPGLKNFATGIRAHDPRRGLPALAFAWLILGGSIAAVLGFSGLMWALWLAVPLAFLVADVFDRIPAHSISSLWAAVLFVGVLALSALFFWLPHMASFLAEVASGEGAHPAFASFLNSSGLTYIFADPFWQQVLQIKTDWGLPPVIAGATLLVSLLAGIYLMRHGALEGAAFVYVGVWFVLFIATQSLAGNVYDHLQEPLKWMSVKIKKEQSLITDVEKRHSTLRVVLYGLNRPSVAFISGVKYKQAGSADAAFKTPSRPLFVITDKRHMPTLADHIPAGTAHECLGGYCLIELYN